MYVLSEQQGLLLRALQPLEEGEGEEKVSHKAGDHWLIRGPLEYVPSAKVEVVEERQAIPLDENEGIYVQDVKTGKVTAEGWTRALLWAEGERCLVQVEGTSVALVAAEPLAGRCEAFCGACAFAFLCLKHLTSHCRHPPGRRGARFRDGDSVPTADLALASRSDWGGQRNRKNRPPPPGPYPDRVLPL